MSFESITQQWGAIEQSLPTPVLSSVVGGSRTKATRDGVADYNAALDRIDSEPENVWFRVSCVLASAVAREELTTDEASKAFHRWSARSAKYNESEATAKLDHALNNYGKDDGGDVSTLYRYAREWPAPAREGDLPEAKPTEFDESKLPTSESGLPFIPVEVGDDGEPTDRHLFSRDAMKRRDRKQAYFIPGLIAKDQVLGIIAAEKSWKTTTVIDLCYQLTSPGGEWMGRKVTGGPYRVLFASGESNEEKMNETDEGIARSNAARGIEPAPEHLWITDRTFPFDSAEAKARLLGYLRHVKPDVFFLDPLYLSLPGDDINNSNVVGQLLNEIRDYCKSEGVTFAIIHHTTKEDSKRAGAPRLVDASNGGVHRWVRQWILMGKMCDPEETRSVEVEMKMGGACGGQDSVVRYLVQPFKQRDEDGVEIWQPQFLTREEYEAWKTERTAEELDDRKAEITSQLRLYFSNTNNPPLSKTKTVQELFGLDRKSKKANALFQRIVYDWNFLEEIEIPGRHQFYGPGAKLDCPDWMPPESKA